MARFGCNSLTSKELRLTIRIEKFSLHLRKGYFVSPEFKSESPVTKWSIVVKADCDADYDNYFEVLLKRNEYVIEEQLAKVKLSIVDFSGSSSLSDEKVIYFNGNTCAQEVLHVTKEDLFRFFGFNKWRLLPNDTLTLLCELVVYTENVTTFNNRKDFANNSASPVQYSIVDCAENFVHSNMKRKKIHFARRFENFSMHSHKGCCVSPEYQSEGCRWSLVVYPYHDCLDIKLRRMDSEGRSQLAEVKLSIVGRFGMFSLCGEKQVCFHDSPEEDSLILTVTEKYMSSCLGLNKLLLMPDDSLTLHCEIVMFEETVNTFDNNEDFAQSVENLDDPTTRPPPMSSLILLSILCVITAYYGISTAYSILQTTITLFINNYVFPFICGVLAFLATVVIASYLLFCLKNKAESCNKANAKAQRQKHKSHNRPRQEMIPYEKQNKMPYRSIEEAVCVIPTPSGDYLVLEKKGKDMEEVRVRVKPTTNGYLIERRRPGW